MKEAVILAGGYGTRLYPLTQTRAKSLLPLAGVPLIHRLVKYLESNGYEKIVVTLNNFSNQIKTSLKELKCRAELIFSEERIPLGTAGSVKKASRYITDTFLVIQGDIITDIGLSRARAFHFKQDAIGTILLKERQDVTGLGVVDLDSRRNIRGFVEKPTFSDSMNRLVSTGIYLLDPRVLDYIPSKRPFDFARDLFPALLQKGLRLKGLPVEGYWIDVGTPRLYKEASRWFLNLLGRHSPSMPANRLGQLVDSDRVINSPTSIIVRKDSGNIGVASVSMIRACSSIDRQATIDGCVLEKRVVVGKGAILRDSIILEDSKIDDGVIIESSIVGEGCHLGRGSSIGSESVLGGYVEVRPNVAIKENSVIPAKSVVELISTQWAYASGSDGVHSCNKA